jgi:cysteine synthase A
MPSTLHPPPLASCILDAIGNTPMVELRRVVQKRKLKGGLLAKLEHLNPGFSKKDRIALEMIRHAKASGDLKDGQTVIELTSGNTGTGLAIVCRALGHPFIAVMSRGNTMERARMMQGLGAEVVLVDQAPGSVPNQVSGEDLGLVRQKAEQLVSQYAAFRINQFQLQANVLAHQLYTGEEIWQQAQGRIDAFVDFVGTAGSFTGVARCLKSKNPHVRAYLLEPASAAVLAGKPMKNSSHKIQGAGYAMTDLPLLDRTLVSDYLQVTDDQAIQGARILAGEEGIFGGFSAGANFAAALELLQTREQGNTIVFLVCDSGLKYLSTDLYPSRVGLSACGR